MHRLSFLSIQNFRACRDVAIPLEGYTPLVGQNNVGKSTILDAIKWVLAPTKLKHSDFHAPNAEVSVIACIEGVSQEILNKVPEEKHRKAIEPFCKDETLWIRVTANGTSAKANSQQVWDIDKFAGKGIPQDWRDYPTGLPQAVSVLLPEPMVIEAMRDIGEDLGKAKAGTTIKDLLDEIMGPLIEAHDDLKGALETIGKILKVDGEDRSDHLKEFDSAASKALEDFFPGLLLDLDLQIVDIKEFFKAGDLHVTDKMTGDRRKFDEIGTGAQRAIQMALIRHLAESRSSDDKRPSRRLLLIDEPELYLHPQGVRHLRQALASLAEKGFQVVFSTHSPMMLNRENAADTIIVRKNKDDGVVTSKPLRHAVEVALGNAESQSRTLFELGNLAEIYFADQVVLCEGKTDRRILQLAYERLYGRPPELDHIAFVSPGSCNDIPKALPVLSAMGIPACAVVDLDFGYTTARHSGLLAKDAQDLVEATRILKMLQSDHGYTLNSDGMPKNDKKSGWSAASVWALFAANDEGSKVSRNTQEALKGQQVWIWQEGCIEQITGVDEKGEEAIINQEDMLREMRAEDIAKNMPAFKACFDWIRSQ